MNNPKKFKDQTFGEKVAFTAGELCLAIGKGNFQETLGAILNGFVNEAYQRGYEAGLAKGKQESYGDGFGSWTPE